MNTGLLNLSRGALGMALLLLVCYLLSVDRRAINWKLVLFGVLAQVMFAMGVLHTTLAGRAVSWMFFGIVLGFTIVRKFLKAKSENASVAINGFSSLITLFWQALFIVGLILAPYLFSS